MVRSISVGIMAYRSRKLTMPFAEASYFRQLIAAASSLAIKAFVFCPLDINWHNRTIYGYAYQNSVGSWFARQFPFPDVVYDRLFPPRGRLANVLFAAAKRLRRQGNVRLFGRSGRGKWETYRALFKHADLKEHIPHTMILRHVDDLAFMIKKYGYVFVKPDMGSQGKGVVAIREIANGFSCHGRDHQNMPFSVNVTSLNAVLALARAASQRKRLLVQQGLNLNHLRGRTFDIRAVVQKDHEGKWQVTGTAVRMGRPNSVTSNLHGGGSAVRTEGLLRNLFAEKSADIMAVLSRLAVSIPELMDRELGRYGELGLDFGVDRDGKVWLIEANSKPGRTIFLHIKDPSLRQVSILRPMQYCKYLALEKRSGGESLG